MLHVSANFFVELLKGPGDRPRYYTIDDALPEDARLVWMQASFTEDKVVFVLESESWSVDDSLPLIDPMPVAHVEYPRVDALA